jgi:5-methyltetrahydropteroyltriglutamate--homocysteine methyltransferase
VNVRTQSVASAAAAKPPFRAEHIGSLLRPANLLRERARFAKGEINAAELADAEDDAITEAIQLQERLGFKFVTDGEFRRRSYHSFFYGALGQLRIDTIGGADALGADGEGRRGAQPVAIIGSRVHWTHPINAADVAFLKSRSDRWPKITIPGPCALHFRGGDAAVTASAYQDVDQFWRIQLTLSRVSFTRLLLPAAVTSRSTRPLSPNSATPTCRARLPRAATIGARSLTNISP